MVERKTRAKTGCLSCRRRRVKCDERRPTCERCQKANIACSGYERARNVLQSRAVGLQHIQHGTEAENLDGWGERKSSRACSPAPQAQCLEKHNSLGFNPNETYDLADFPSPKPDQQPHQRAQDVLALQHFSSRTTKLLFRPIHISFWRGPVVQAAWHCECLFDAIVAVGTMHRAILGLETQVAAFQAYGNALEQINGACVKGKDLDHEDMIATLLLLTYFECFANNAASAFRHLRTARHSLSSADWSALPNHEPLIGAVNELSLLALIVLPMEHFPLYANSISGPTINQAPPEPPSEIEQLFDFILGYPEINRAVWTPLSGTGDQLSVATLIDFQKSLFRLHSSFQHVDNFSADETCESNYTQIPPQPITLPTADAALAAVLFKCYIARTSNLLSKKLPDDSEQYKAVTQSSVYDLFRVIEGVRRERVQRASPIHAFTPRHVFNIGFIPILFLGATICEISVWRRWAVTTLRALGRESLYDGAVLANALEVVDMFRTHAKMEVKLNISPILVPEVEGKSFVVYYAHEMEGLSLPMFAPVKIIGRARWSGESEGRTKSVMIDFFDESHPMNEEVLDQCVYKRIAAAESNVQAWRSLFSLPATNNKDFF